VAFAGISPFHLSVPCVVLGEAHPGLPDFELRVCAWEPSPLATSAGFALQIGHDLSALDDAHTIIVPSWRDVNEPAPAVLINALVAAYVRGACLVGLCLGAYVLAQAGLLDGRRAGTHWEAATDFARRFPKVQLDADALYVVDGNLVTSAGTAAGLDCCLHLLRRQYGVKIANSVARRLVVPPHRLGGQAQFIEHPLPANAADARLSDMFAWVRANLALPHTLAGLAGRALMSRRSFTRRFARLTGMSVGQWLLAERLTRSQSLLEGSDYSVEHVAQLAGFGSPESLRLHFRRAFGVSPAAWRTTFRGAGGHASS
jgi:transcriptional regulator GlxA family with amidase domain